MLHYNENKIEEKQARLILSSGFATDITGMSLEQKLQRFEHRTILNARVKTNAIHISLNFDAQDKLSDQHLQQIASAYMERIGFGEQPYLVYRHTDAAHTHVHITTTNIRADGTRIDIHDIGKTLSETARKELEKEYNLVKADGRQNSNALGIKAADIQKATYGKTPTKRTITNIVGGVIHNYKFSSLAEFNAVLRQFNVTADRGREDTMFRKNGLIYSIINEKGEKVGVPIKASAIYEKPTLNNLEKSFVQGAERRKVFREPLREAIDKVFKDYLAITKATFVAELARQNIDVVFRQNDKGLTYGITFVDNKRKTVFNGSDLGKAFSAKAITERFSLVEKSLKKEKELKKEQDTYLKAPKHKTYLKSPQQQKTYLKAPEQGPYLKGLLDKSITDYGQGMPAKKKKKKRSPEQQQEQSL
jgi:hypothetical protein